MTYIGSIENVLDVAAHVTGVSKDQMRGGSRKRAVAYPRFIAMKAVREATGKSFPTIGRSLRKDHSTVISGIKRAGEIIADNQDAADHFHKIMVTAARSKAMGFCFASQQIDRSALV
jgi:chromosomal replication initiator protein